MVIIVIFFGDNGTEAVTECVSGLKQRWGFFFLAQTL